MATVVQESSSYNATVTATPTIVLGNTTTGNTLIIAVEAFDSVTAPTVSSISISTGSATFTKVVSNAGGGNLMPIEIWAAANITGGTTPTVTVHLSAAPAFGSSIGFIEASGLLSTLTADGTNSATGNSAAPNSGNITTVNAADLAVAVLSSNNPITGTAGWNQDIHSGFKVFEWIALSSAQTIAATGTATSGAWTAAIAAFQGSLLGLGNDPWSLLNAVGAILPPQIDVTNTTSAQSAAVPNQPAPTSFHQGAQKENWLPTDLANLYKSIWDEVNRSHWK